MNLPNDDASAALVEAVLKALAARFSDAAVKVDETVFNASRIVKAYGAVACKGDDVPERPHRLSRILDAPAHVEAVPRELLEEMARPEKGMAKVPDPFEAHKISASRSSSRFDIDAFVARHLTAREPVAHEDGRKWVLEECPFDAGHKAPDAAIFQHSDRSIGFKCFHNSCAGKTWKDVRERFEGPRQNRPAAPEPPPVRDEDAPPPRKQDRPAAGRAQPPKLLTYEELKKIETPMQRVLFDGFPLPASGATLLFGQSKAGKTVLALKTALAIARDGHPRLTAKGRVWPMLMAPAEEAGGYVQNTKEEAAAETGVGASGFGTIQSSSPEQPLHQKAANERFRVGE